MLNYMFTTNTAHTHTLYYKRAGMHAHMVILLMCVCVNECVMRAKKEREGESKLYNNIYARTYTYTHTTIAHNTNMYIY
jgi:hypothetical protein